ncbi:Increased rDNA silencing protein [Elasticomyces elasticus]|nr:Increased rDNA silencing protein [Elasticomyces elasticus]
MTVHSSRSSRSPSSNREAYAVDRNAALRGASTAFAKPNVRPAALRRTSSGANGALAAATAAGMSRKMASPQVSLLRPGQDDSRTVNHIDSKQRAAENAVESIPKHESMLNAPLRTRPTQAPSPSTVAAGLAAARASSSTQTQMRQYSSKATAALQPSSQLRRPPPSTKDSSGKAVLPDGAPTDTTSIPPTTSLVKLFEQKAVVDGQYRALASTTTVPSASPTIKSPKPVPTTRLSGGHPASTPLRNKLSEDQRVQLDKNTIKDTSGTIQRLDSGRPDSNNPDSDVPYASAYGDILNPPIIKKFRDTPARRNKPAISSPMIQPELSQAVSVSVRPKPIPFISITSMTPVPRSTASPSEPFPPQPPRSITATYKQLHPRHITPLTTGNDIANAIVASSLASSRVPSPVPRPIHSPPIPAARHSKSRTFLHPHRTSSPARPTAGLSKHTLRKHSSTSDTSDEEGPYSKHKRKRHLRKHPNKHAEGSRKRWCDTINERERKRYEELFVSNKVLQLSATPPSDASEVAFVWNVVVRDIWTRSRLPGHVLEEVWELVDTQGAGRLAKEEFVVGLWLIDQRLKGRKLPVRVSESVWASVKWTSGIRMRRKWG